MPAAREPSERAWELASDVPHSQHCSPDVYLPDPCCSPCNQYMAALAIDAALADARREGEEAERARTLKVIANRTVIFARGYSVCKRDGSAVDIASWEAHLNELSMLANDLGFSVQAVEDSIRALLAPPTTGTETKETK